MGCVIQNFGKNFDLWQVTCLVCAGLCQNFVSNLAHSNHVLLMESLHLCRRAMYPPKMFLLRTQYLLATTWQAGTFLLKAVSMRCAAHQVCSLTRHNPGTAGAKISLGHGQRKQHDNPKAVPAAPRKSYLFCRATGATHYLCSPARWHRCTGHRTSCKNDSFLLNK